MGDQGQGTSWIEHFKDRILRAFDSAGSVDSWKAQIYGFIIATSTKVRTSARALTNANPIDVSVVDASGNQVTSFGVGTEYADGAARGTATGTLIMVDDGTNIQSAAGTTAGLVKVDISGTAANTTAIKVDGSAVTQPVSGTVSITANSSINLAQVNGTTTVNGGSAAGILAVGGPNATNVAITGNPTNLGAQAVSSENTAVTTARQVQLVADLVGKLIVLPYANPENFVSGAITSAMTGTTTTSLIAAPAGSLRNYITQITVSNSHATVGTDIIIQDGSGGTTLYTIPAAPAYGGAVITFPTPLRQPTTATAIFCANVTTGSNTKVSVSGYRGL